MQAQLAEALTNAQARVDAAEAALRAAPDCPSAQRFLLYANKLLALWEDRVRDER